MAKMTREEAIAQATDWHNQKIPYHVIAQRLNDMGYVSPKTGEPVKGITVRHMIVGPAVKEAAPDPTFQVKADADDFVHGVEHLLSADNISNAMKKKMIVALLEASGSRN